MRRARWVAALTLMVLAQIGVSGFAAAAQKIAIFPIDLSFPKTEEDFFRGVSGPSPEEQKRLGMARDELTKRVAADGRYEIVDLKPLDQELTAAQPFYDCNGCEVELGKKANADLVMTSLVEKISETHLSLTVAILDVAKGSLVSTSSVLIQGNTDEAWLHGVKWLAKNRLFAEAKPQ